MVMPVPDAAGLRLLHGEKGKFVRCIEALKIHEIMKFQLHTEFAQLVACDHSRKLPQPTNPHHGRARPWGVRRAPQRAESFSTWWSTKTPIHHPQQFAGEQSEEIFEQQRREFEDLDGADASNIGAAQRARQREWRCLELAHIHVLCLWLKLGHPAPLLLPIGPRD